MSDEANKELLGSMKRLFNDSKYSDLTIVSSEKEYHVHRAIVCPRSEFFAAACDGGFKEAQDGRITLLDDDPQAVDMMIEYFYTLDYPHITLDSGGGQQPDGGDKDKVSASRASTVIAGGSPSTEQVPPPVPTPPYTNPPAAVSSSSTRRQPSPPPPPPPNEDDIWGDWGSWSSKKKKEKAKAAGVPDPDGESRPPNFGIHARVYAIAEQYGIAGLKAVACQKFALDARYHWDTHDFLHVIPEVYDSTVESDRGMRDQVLATLYQHMTLLDKEEVKEVLKGVDGLAYDFVMYVYREKDGNWGW